MNKQFFSNILPDTRLFGRFKLLRCLSAGPLAGVYLCLDEERGNNKIVLKVISTKPASSVGDLDKFRKEVEISHSIRHENVLASDKFFVDDDFAAYTMEYMEGGTLAETIRSRTVLSVKEIVDILLQLTRGIGAIHACGIVHRDLKPENILIDLAGGLKIADFGIAAHMSAPANTTSDDLVGSINYLSPEYIEIGACDQRSDIYSIGVIAYQLITGSLPFEAETMIETLTIRVLHDPQPPKRRRHDIPESLNRFVLRALQRNPLRRFQQISAMIRALENIKESEEFPYTSSLGGLLNSKNEVI